MMKEQIPIIKHALKVTRDMYYKKHLAIISPLLPKTMTDKEMEVLAQFMALKGSITTERFGTTARKQVREKLNLSHGGLGNYLKSLKDKGFIKEVDGQTIILSFLYPASRVQGYNIILENTEE